MIHPTHIRYDRRFSVTGTVTAISLTKSLPQGVDVDILVLGLDDVRNILYTAYMEAAFRESHLYRSSRRRCRVGDVPARLPRLTGATWTYL